MTTLKGSIFLTPKDIQQIVGCSLISARREYKKIRTALQKDRITITDYCNYWKADLQLITDHLNQFR